MSKIVSITQQKENLRNAINYLDMLSSKCILARQVRLLKPANFMWAWEQIRQVLEEKELIPYDRTDGLRAITYAIDEMHTLPPDMIFVKGEKK